ncbi:response regulator transcription factor [Chryseobacterium sp. R2A-55]|uniref:response regulator transcription factor n=1 Tax=Chryseobacterium sp. R2A-55 TaxID=2744445 RepID=UPI001F1E2AEF|nr:response regulator transcription factor [Chryseobacterium sp. R2A-55]
MKKEILLYDSHVIFLQALKYFLERNGFHQKYDFSITTKFEEMGVLISDRTTLLIMNILGVGLCETFSFVENVLKNFVKLKIILLTTSAELKIVKRFFDKGVKGLLTNETNSDEFLGGIRKVLEGQTYINKVAKEALFGFICNKENVFDRKCYGSEDLTEREKVVLTLICDGYRTKDIADKLFISTHTVESHRRNIMLKLNVNNSSKLVKLALENNLVK